MTGQDEILGQLFADGVVHRMSPTGSTDLLRVQVNHFSCGGLGMAISMSHQIGDACSLASFLTRWAAVARCDHQQVLSLTPHFIHHPPQPEPPAPLAPAPAMRFVARRFVFPNSKLSELKKKIAGTRVQLLTSLLYKTAATTKRGSFNPSSLFLMVNMRAKFVEKLPQTTIGNFVSLMRVPTRHTSEISLPMVVAEIKKRMLEFEGIQSIQQLADNSRSLMGDQDLENAYFCSSFCGFPFNKLDFGWGKPMATTLATKSTAKNGFVLMDTPDGDGVEAFAMLEEQHMGIFENDKEMLSFCQTN